MLANNIYTNERVSEYLSIGFAPIPVKLKAKEPIGRWKELQISRDDVGKYFDGAPVNIGIVTGTRSGGLVDVDIDAPAALRFGPYFLPKTDCVFGHESKPESHWVYRVKHPESIEQFRADGMIVEVRGNAHYTVFPGSVHESGELIEFEDRNNIKPCSSDWKELVCAASKVAIATLLFEAWTPGQRHDLALATAAKLARLGWRRDEVRI